MKTKVCRTFNKIYYWIQTGFENICFIFLEQEIRGRRSYTDPHYDEHCWNTSKTFNNRSYRVSFQCGIRCISKYRVRDGIEDCFPTEESNNINNSCPQIQRHRLQCSSSELTCLLPGAIGDWVPNCSNGRDESDYETTTVFVNNLKCENPTDPGCTYLRNYIKNSSQTDIKKATNVANTMVDGHSKITIPFRFYCDSFFDTASAIDELSEFCKNWTCSTDQYQCLSGQCILLDWVCDGKFIILLL